MRMTMMWLCVLGLTFLTGSAKAETKVELKGVHLCCGNCVKVVGETLAKVDGVKGKCDRPKKTISITATDDDAAKKALAALADAGFYGTSDNDKVSIKKGDAPSGKVKSATVSGAHNCCPACCKALKETVKKVDGVTSDTAKPKGESFEVKGDFDASELVKALNDAGFNVTVK